MRRIPRLRVARQWIPILSGVRLAVVIAMSLAICYYGYRFYANVSGLRRTQTTIAERSKTIESISAEVATATGAGTAITPVEPPLDGGKFMSTFIQQITDLSLRTNCKLSSIKPKPVEVATDPNAPNKDPVKYKPIEVSIEMLTDYRGVNDFIAGLSKLPKVAKVTQIDLSRHSIDPVTHQPVLDANLTLVLCMLEPGGKSI